MKRSQREQAFVERIKNALDAGNERLDPHVLYRLKQARKWALEGRVGKAGSRRVWLPLPVAGLAVALIVLSAITLFMNRPAEMKPYASLEDVEILASADHLELFADLDFYTWLAEEEDRAG